MGRSMILRPRMLAGCLGAAFVAVSAIACDPAGVDRILEIEARAAVTGFVFVDTNGSGDFEAQDSAARVPVALVLFGTADTVARTATDADGLFAFLDVPVGRYEVAVQQSGLGDSLVVVLADQPFEEPGAVGDSSIVELALGDTAQVRIGIAFPTVTVAEARTLPQGRKVIVHAVSQTLTNEYGDSSIYVLDAKDALRVTRLSQPQIFVGDTVNIVGIVDRRAEQPVLRNVDSFIMAPGSPVTPLDIAASEVADARGGTLDARLVRVKGLAVEDTTVIDADEVILNTRYGSTEVEVLVFQDGSFDLAAYPEQTTIDVTGVLVPVADGSAWRLQPRSAADIVIRP